MLRIKFLGIGEQIHQVKARLERERNSFSFPLRTEIVNQHQQILRHNIRGIPSVMINDQIVIEGRMPSIQELKDSIHQYHSNIQKPNSMKSDTIQKILVPMDSSSTAISALRYAKDLASSLQAEIQIIHVCSFHFDHSTNEFPNSMEELKQTKVKALEQLIAKSFPEDEDTKNILCEIGFPIDIIAEQSKAYDLVIMGSTGEHSLVDKLLGSISSGVAQQAHCPVILIPEKLEIFNLKKILCAYQAKNIYSGLINQLIQLSPGTPPEEIHFVEINAPNKELVKKPRPGILSEIQNSHPSNIHYVINQIKGDSVVNSLNEYAAEYDLGMIVMTTKHRKPLQAFFHKSSTKQMVLDIKRPLLILHSDD